MATAAVIVAAAYDTFGIGMKKRDHSKVIERAVRAGVFHRTIQDIKARNADTDPEELRAIVDEAVREVRAEQRGRGKLTERDAGGARYQYFGVGAFGPSGIFCRDLSRLA